MCDRQWVGTYPVDPSINLFVGQWVGTYPVDPLTYLLVMLHCLEL